MPPKRAASTKRAAPVARGSDSEDSPSGEDFNETVEEAKASSSKRPAAKRTTSAKRKAADEDEEEAGPSKAKVAKKAKTSAGESKAASAAAEGELAPNGQPTNKVLPVHIQFAPKAEDAVRIATWNICGLGASSKKVRPATVM